jgi:phospho-N-acetylmuramoyl-pentapeptide-transferase
VCVVIGPRLIKKLHKLKITEKLFKSDSPQLDALHSKKEGTPTMGGILVVIAVIFSCFLWADLSNRFMLLVLFVFLWLAVLGFVDDLIKLRKSPRGLRGRNKFLGQIALGLIVGIYLFYHPPDLAVLWNVDMVNSDYSPFLTHYYAPVLTVPFCKESFLNLSWLYILFVVLVIVGSSNAVNLTDGLDGLAIGNALFVALVYAILSYVVGNWKISKYLGILFVEGSGELAVFCSSLIGACLGFLWFNAYPAQIFMGDTGSLALGGAIGAVAVVTKQELLLVIAGGIFVVEALSVVLQVVSFRLRKKRVFAIAPLHHHFEFRGWAEPKVIIRFWIISAILALISLSTLKLR